MSLTFTESGLVFGDFEPEDVFAIEKSEWVKKLGAGIDKVEFILKQSHHAKVILLEAKSSYPRESDDFFNGIKQKMMHSLMIWFAAVVGRHVNIKQEIGDNLKTVADLKKNIQLILVIPKMPDEYCAVASDKFRKVMQPERKLWNIKDIDIKVLNAKKVSQMGLLSPTH